MYVYQWLNTRQKERNASWLAMELRIFSLCHTLLLNIKIMQSLFCKSYNSSSEM